MQIDSLNGSRSCVFFLSSFNDTEQRLDDFSSFSSFSFFFLLFAEFVILHYRVLGACKKAEYV
jgi:hypothetical protein